MTRAVIASYRGGHVRDKSFAARLTRLRKERGFTQESLAEALGHERPSQVNVWENELFRPPERRSLLELARVLKVTPHELVDDLPLSEILKLSATEYYSARRKHTKRGRPRAVG